MKQEFLNKIISIQQQLKAPKSKYNSFGGYNYRSTEDILEAVKPLLAAQGLILTLSDEIVGIGDRYYVKATATITDGIDSLSVSANAREQAAKKGMDESQITGSASAYARKYALNGLLNIDDTKEADTEEQANETKKRSKKNEEEPVICPKCGAKLKSVIHTRERAYTAAEYLENCGMCPECYVHKLAAEKNAGENK